jgi:hypothetical protein
MLMTISRMVAVVGLVASVVSCSEEDPAPNPREERCARIVRATCAALVRCRALVPNSQRLVTNQDCERTTTQFVPECMSGAQYDGVSSATDEEISACVSGFEAVACSDVCNQVPQDPAPCQPLDTMPSHTFIECAP